MKAPTLQIADNLSLPLDYVTTTSAIVAKKRVGKSYLAQKIAERLLAAKQQVVVIDLTSVWWGLRSSADGKSPGYPITIFGGRHGDVPLEATAGEMVANAIVSDRFSAVLDVRLLKKGQRIRFIADFLEALYDKNTTAMHLFMDEADAYIPQRSFSPEEARALGAADELVRRGGSGGIGVTMITQRAAVLNKNVLSQVDTLSILRTNHPKDIDSVEDWMEHHTTDRKLIDDITSSLSSLPRGDAWYLDPEHKVFKRISVSPKETYDSGRTPKVGEQVKPPKVLAKVDLERLGANIKSTVEQAKANDPKALKARVAELEKQLVKETDAAQRAIAAGSKIIASKPTRTIDKPIIKDAQLKRIEAAISRGDELADGIGKAAIAAEEKLDAATDRAEQIAVKITAELEKLRETMKAFTAPPPTPPTSNPGRARALGDAYGKALPKETGDWNTKSAPKVNGHGLIKSVETGGLKCLKPAHLRILSAIAWWESIGVSDPDIVGIAFVAGASPKSSAFVNNRSRLHAAGYITYPSSKRASLTELGRETAPPPQIPSTNAALHDAILKMVTPAHGRMLRALIETYPNEISLEDFAERSGASPTSSAFVNNRSWLRARGLAMYPQSGFVRATELLFPEAS